MYVERIEVNINVKDLNFIITIVLNMEIHQYFLLIYNYYIFIVIIKEVQ